MSEAVTAIRFRQKLAARIAADLRDGGFIAFGSGGHAADNTSLPVDQMALGLRDEFARIPIRVVWQEDPLSLTAEAAITSAQMAGRPLSEAAILDSDGDPVVFKTFGAKYADILETGEGYAVKLTARF